MKIKERALALLLSMVMVLTFMPALAFAEGDGGADADAVPAVEETTDVVNEAVEDSAEEALTEAPDLVESAPAATDGEGAWDLWYLDGNDEFFYPWFEDEYTFNIYAYGYNESGKTLSYEWSKDGAVLESGVVSEYSDDNEFTLELQIKSAGTYDFTIKDDDQNEISDSYAVYEPLMQNGLLFGEGEENTAWVQTYWTDETGPTGNVVIPATVTLTNGRTLPITEVWGWFDNAKSITIPASVKSVDLVGLSDYENYNEETGIYEGAKLIPGFVIFGTTGSAAHQWASKYGIAFRDLAAEAVAAAEAARQGTYDPSLPKVKASKPKASKKAFTAKWKKLKKKQLKSGATNIEVWACADGAFSAGSTIERVVGKKKASTKIKGMAKGTYFVKVRAIKYVGGVKYVGPWSAVKKVKVKK